METSFHEHTSPDALFYATAEGENLERLTEGGQQQVQPIRRMGQKSLMCHTVTVIHIYLMDTNGSQTHEYSTGVDNILPSWLAAMHAVCRHLGENSNAPATRDDLNERGAEA